MNEDVVKTPVEKFENWMFTKEIAGISSFRERMENCTPKTLKDKDPGGTYSPSENCERDRTLHSTLLVLKYGVTELAGSYLESGREAKEKSYVVINLNEDPDFRRNLCRLGEYYGRDSILFKNANSDRALLVGTNESGDPGYGIEKDAGVFQDIVNAEYMNTVRTAEFEFVKKRYSVMLHKLYMLSEKIRSEIGKHPTTKEMCYHLDLEMFDDLSIMGKYPTALTAAPTMRAITEDWGDEPGK